MGLSSRCSEQVLIYNSRSNNMRGHDRVSIMHNIYVNDVDIHNIHALLTYVSHLYMPHSSRISIKISTT